MGINFSADPVRLIYIPQVQQLFPRQRQGVIIPNDINLDTHPEGPRIRRYIADPRQWRADFNEIRRMIWDANSEEETERLTGHITVIRAIQIYLWERWSVRV